MSEFRRRLMIANAKQGGGGDLPFDYIQDGLAFHLDGINKGNDSTAWTDLIGGTKFTYTKCTINTDNVEFSGNGSYAKAIDDLTISPYDGTIEVVFEQKQMNRNQVLYMPDKINSIAFGIYSREQFIWATMEYPVYNNIPIGLKAVSLHKHFGVINKTKVVQDTKKNNWAKYEKGIAYLGCRAKSDFFKGKIYSVRIYNRQLTEQEMLHNQQVDIDRFFGGVTPQ